MDQNAPSPPSGTRLSAPPRRIVVGISGASGFIYGYRLLEALEAAGIERHLVITKSAQLTRELETELSLEDVTARATAHYPAMDLAAAISSGSFRHDGMIVAPCSIRSLSEIATGMTTQLLTRAADVTLKERRPLILMVRETPFHLGHLRTMAAVTEMGGIIAPPLPAFYPLPENINDVINHSVGRVLDLLNISHQLVSRWK